LSYERLRADFRWSAPARYNIGTACADTREPAAPAIHSIGPKGATRTLSFGDLTRLSNRLANGLKRLGVEPGDRVGIVLPQCEQTCIAHLATYKCGAIAVPMSILFGLDALAYRFDDCRPRLVVADRDRLDAVSEACGDAVVVAHETDPRARHDFWRLIDEGSSSFTPVDTSPDDPALLMYTSGTTGAPKGALHAHGMLLGHQPGFALSHDGFPKPGDVFWTPADWAWIGGLVNGLLLTLTNGRPIVAAPRVRFDPEWAGQLIESHRVRNVFLSPTALKLMREAQVSIPSGTLRTAMSGGEALGGDLLEWAREHLDVTINEIYGQTEANYVIGNSHECWPIRPGSMGRPYPGHDLAVLDGDDSPAQAGATGELALRLPDPVAFLGYWRAEAATASKVRNGWLRTGDLATADEDGYIWFHGRADDLISSSGYRIGPEEIEQCLNRHQAVSMAAVVGVPDPVRGQVVKAFLQLKGGVEPCDELRDEIQDFVRRRLAAYAYPRLIEFVDEIPLTTTGKIRRAALREPAGIEPSLPDGTAI
jgi:acetyl-CoA synthetase